MTPSKNTKNIKQAHPQKPAFFDVYALPALIFLVGIALVALFSLSGLDGMLAQYAYRPGSWLGGAVLHLGPYPAIACTVIAIAALFKKQPLVRRTAILWLLTLGLGAGVLTNMALKPHVDRPRPRQTVLLNGPMPYLAPLGSAIGAGGRSFPAGHPTMGFIFCAPFFLLRRKKTKTAWGCMAFGLAFGGFLGWGRMLAGAHYASDVLGAATVMLFTASVIAPHLSRTWPRWFVWLSPVMLLAVLMSLILVTPFDRNVNMVILHPQATGYRLETPCGRVQIHRAAAFSVDVDMDGFGTPLGRIALQMDKSGTIMLHKPGFFREFSCTATVTVPPHLTLRLPGRQGFSSMGITPETRLDKNGDRIFAY